MAIDLSSLSTREALTAIYIGYYDRAADPAGIQFWEQVVSDTSLDLVAITSDFAGQVETQDVHPFFADPATSSPATFITSLYQNLFNRDADAEGLAFWSAALQDAIDGVEGAISVGQIITSIIEGAVDVEGGTQDRTTILNKIEVGLDWTEAAEAAELTYERGSNAETSARAVIEGVTEDPATVTAAKAATDDFFEDDGGETGGGTPGEERLLTSDTDVLSGTDNDDTFNAYIAQNPLVGGVSNTLSSADRLDGGAGNDRLYAEITNEFVGVGVVGITDVQPRTSGIEEIDIEARDGDGFDVNTTVDAKRIEDHEEIGSFYSDGDLVIENVTTLTSGGAARNTSEITVTMDHTDNFNSDDDASDLAVYFDNDYLLSGQESEGEIRYFLLDEDAELAGLDNRLDNIDVDGIRFNIFSADGTFENVVIESDAANTAGTHQGFVNALQAPLQALIDDGTLPAGTTLTLNPLFTDFTFLDDGSRSDDIPAIVVTSGDGSRIEATGFSRIEEEIGEYDVYGRFESRNETADQPISVDIDLHKAGRGGEGGDLVVGGKAQNTDEDSIADGIEVFNIMVSGRGDGDDAGMTKPSNVGTVTSTGNELEVVNITTAPEFASGTTFASLTVRNGFDQDGFNNVESGDLRVVNADGFLGDLTLGDIDANNNAGRITNADTITAQGGGDVELGLLLDGTETNQAYSVTTGAGNDSVDMLIDGDATDFGRSSVNISTSAGDDSISVDLFQALGSTNNGLNQAILDNVTLDAGAGNDRINADGIGDAMIFGRDGNDVITTDGDSATGANAVWAVNHDETVEALAGASLTPPEDLPGEPLSLAYVGNAVVTVTLSGAGIAAYADGGGLMSQGAAARLDNGYESNARINTLNNGNDYFGDQTDVNDAIMRAINNDPVLSNLLTASMGANNTLVIASTTSGNFDATDLRIDIAQETYTDATYANAVAAEARSVFSNSALTAADMFVGTGPNSAFDGHTNGAGADLSGNNADAWFDGLSTRGNAIQTDDNLHTTGAASIDETDNMIDGGTGDDVIVLSTDAIGAAGAVLRENGASNETVVMTGNTFGDDTVMNFTALDTEAGLDFLDFTAYLSSQFDFSAGTPGTGANSFRDIATTLDTDTASVNANEVAIIDFNPTNGSAWENLSASDIQGLFNNTISGGNYDTSLTQGAFSTNNGYSATALIDGDAAAIVMVQNLDNDGEYKVFELTWNGSSAANVDHTVTATALGSLDFGDTLDNGGTDSFLVGSAGYDAFTL